MKPLIIFARWLHVMGLAVWIGGLLVIGAIVAPVAFKHSGLTPALAGNVVAGSFARFNVLSYVVVALLLCAQGIEWGGLAKTSPKWRRLAAGRLLLTVAMLALALYLGLSVAPQMFADRAAGSKAAFDALHHFYGALARVQVFLAMGVALLSAWMSLER